MRSRRMGVALPALAALAMLVGCGTSQPVPSGGVTATPVAASPSLSQASPAPASSAAGSPSPSPSAGSGTIAWEPDGSVQTATLKVPRDYADPTGPMIDLLLVKRPAGDPTSRIGTMLVNPGGPGASGADMVRQDWIGGLPKPVLDSFDIVGWDPRGVGGSTHVDCPDQVTVQRIEALDPAPSTVADFKANTDLFGSVAAQCAAASGPLLPFLSTDETARDMDRIRVGLGEDKISYYGVSYGTFLGARYATLFPDHLRAAVLDGAIDPGLDLVGRDVAQARGFEAAFDHFLAACHAAKDCAFHGGGDPAKAFDALVARIRQAPLQTSSGSPLGPGAAWYGVLSHLYENSFDGLAHDLAAADAGDGSALLASADRYVTPEQPSAWGSFLGIACLDAPRPHDAAAAEAIYLKMRKATPRIGAFVALETPCLDWPAKHAALPPATGVGLPPIVVLGSTGDPATPYPEAAKLASALRSGVVLTRVGIGHTALNGGLNDCLTFAVQHYLVDLVPPPVGTTCPDSPIVTFTK